MKYANAILVALLFVCVASMVNAEVITFNTSQGEAGFNLLSQSVSGVETEYSLQQLAFEDIEIDGQSMKVIHIPGVLLPNNEGAPNLPGTGRMIAIPQGASASFRIISVQTEVFEDMDIAPAPAIPFETDDSPPVYQKDPDIYNVDSYYPESPVMLSEPAKIRGVDYVILGITPFQYNPVTRELVVYKDIRVEVSFNGGNGYFGEDRLRNRYWEPVLRGNLLNYESLPEVDLFRIPDNPSDDEDLEYVIIVPNDNEFIAWGDTIKAWRT